MKIYASGLAYDINYYVMVYMPHRSNDIHWIHLSHSRMWTEEIR